MWYCPNGSTFTFDIAQVYYSRQNLTFINNWLWFVNFCCHSNHLSNLLCVCDIVLLAQPWPLILHRCTPKEQNLTFISKWLWLVNLCCLANFASYPTMSHTDLSQRKSNFKRWGTYGVNACVHIRLPVNIEDLSCLGPWIR